ncbi:MAG: DUF445 domain-containing protein [Formivibrio sp.]|nr:DUF445 domain-containing protein [Formivibrio sp.]
MTTSNAPEWAPDDLETLCKRLRLKRMKLASLGMLLLAAVIYLISTALSARHPALPYLAAFAEAAMVGALADWFAVVALFRHPLGLPIPHTAIIPKNKGRIADNLGSFIQGHFLSIERIRGKLNEFNPASRLVVWLNKAQTQRYLGNLAVRALSYGVNTLDDRRVFAFLQSTLVAQLQRVEISKIGGSLLEILTQDGRHHFLLNEVLQEFDRQLDRPEIQEKLATLIAGEFDILRYVHLDKAAGRFAAEKLVHGIQKELQDIYADPDHAMRQRFDRYMVGFVDKLKNDPAFHQKGEQLKHELLAHPAVASYVHTLWQQFLGWLHNDIHRTDSTIRAQIVAGVATLGAKLQADPNMQAWINEQVEQAVPPLIEEHREQIGQFIAEQVKAWDDRYMADRLELNLGTDLQYIRLNGTLVGGLVGLLIYAATEWIQH